MESTLENPTKSKRSILTTVIGLNAGLWGMWYFIHRMEDRPLLDDLPKFIFISLLLTIVVPLGTKMYLNLKSEK